MAVSHDILKVSWRISEQIMGDSFAIQWTSNPKKWLLTIQFQLSSDVIHLTVELEVAAHIS
jgi:hypothetical protein